MNEALYRRPHGKVNMEVEGRKGMAKCREIREGEMGGKEGGEASREVEDG